MELSTRRHVVVLATLTASLSMVGCAATSGAGGPPGATRHEYVFDVTAVRTGGTVTGIEVVPHDSPSPGLYRGGHARIEISQGVTQAIVWRSDDRFWIRFEGLKSDKGNGGGHLGNSDPAAYTEALHVAPSGPYEYRVVLSPRMVGKAESVKYWLNVTDRTGFELDPVIIVDR